MREFIINCLAFLGAGVVFVMVLLALIMALEWIRDQIDMAIYRHKRKHRFDKKPIAECYCKDCVYYSIAFERCSTYGRCMRDNDFCSLATPNKRDPEKKEK